MRDAHHDPLAFKAHKAQQRDQWSSVARGWRRRWPVFEQAAQSLSDRLLDLAQVAPGQRVLDVATGIGEPAMTAARRIGPSGSVVAVDQAPQMLAVARERLQSAGIGNVELVEADAETVTLPPASFDAIVSRWGLPFFRDPVATLARLRASLVPGGRLAAAVWGLPKQVPIIGLPFAVLNREMGPPPLPASASASASASGGANPFALSEPAALEQVVRAAGFTDVHTEPFTVTFTWPSVDELVGHLRDVSAPLQVIMAGQSAERQAEFWRRLAEAAASYAAADGAVRLPNACLIVAGHR